MIKVEMCRGCGRPLFTMAVANLTVRCDVEPLNAQTVLPELMGGRDVWRVTYTGSTPSRLAPARPAVLGALKTAEPGERPIVVAEHRCTGNPSGVPVAPRKPSVALEVPTCPKGGESGAQGGARAGSAEPVTPPRSSAQPLASSASCAR